MNIRSSGPKLHFIDLLQSNQKLQLIHRKDLETVRKGDIVEAVGIPGRSQRGELSCKLQDLKVLAPCVINLPDDKIGIRNKDLRCTKRHLDLIANPDSYNIFKIRSKIISTIRMFLESRGFMEVETPILSVLSGGAIARPFRTIQSSDRRELSLRIAPELYLKRLLIGGFDRVFELGKQFRDEGIDSTHNPEFTSCEFYAAYTDLDEIALMLKELFDELAGVCGNEGSAILKSSAEFKRIDLVSELERLSGTKIDPQDPNSFLQPKLLSLLPDPHPVPPASKVFDKLVSHLIEPQCITPTLLYGHPTFLSPLAKESHGRPGISDRFELFVNGRELANAYSELNDPVEQSLRFRLQSELKNGEVPEADEEFVDALRTGMPPTTGCGIGIDRLVMLLTGRTQIRDVLFFPSYKTDYQINKNVDLF